MSALSRAARLLLWDYDRGSLAYDLLCALLLLLVLLLPAELLRDPLAPSR